MSTEKLYRHSFKMICCFIIVTMDLTLTAYAAKPYRAYSEEPLPKEKIAILTTFHALAFWGGRMSRTQVYTLNGEDVHKEWKKSNKSMELLPGKYIIDVGLAGDIKTKHKMKLTLNAKAGHVYFIKPQINRKTYSWNPEIIDITDNHEEFIKKAGPGIDFEVF